MSTVLVFGASGAIGRFLVPRLRRAGHDVIAVSRRSHARAHAQVRWIVGDLDQGLVPPGPVDVIVSAGPLDAFARWFAQAPSGPAPRVIAFGSTSAHSKTESVDPAERALAARLQAAERQLADQAIARDAGLTVFRPTLIYGAGIDRSLAPIARFARRWRIFPRISGACGLRQPVHADDLAAACIAAMENTSMAGRTYAIGGGERLTFAAMLERVRASVPVPCVALPIPLAASRAMASMSVAVGLRMASIGAIQRLTVDLVADNAAAADDFDWAPRAFHPTWASWQPHLALD